MRCYSTTSPLSASQVYFSCAFVLIAIVLISELSLLSEHLYIRRLHCGRCTHSPRIIQWNRSNANFNIRANGLINTATCYLGFGDTLTSEIPLASAYLT